MSTEQTLAIMAAILRAGETISTEVFTLNSDANIVEEAGRLLKEAEKVAKNYLLSEGTP